MKEKSTLQKSMDKALNEFKNNDIQKSYSESYSAITTCGMMICGAIIIDEEKAESVGTVYGKIKKVYKTKAEPYKNGYKVTFSNEDYQTIKIKE